MTFPRHEPPAYSCPFCRLQQGQFDERNQAEDVIAVTDRAYARVAPKWWPGNRGAALVIPRAHVENLYEISAEDGHAVWDLTQRVARAIRNSLGCSGTSMRQHNEPSGDQDVWHLHVHVFPRYDSDDLYRRHDQATWAAPQERLRVRAGAAHYPGTAHDVWVRPRECHYLVARSACGDPQALPRRAVGRV